MSSSKPKCIFDVGGPIHSSAVFRIRDDGSLYLLEKTLLDFGLSAAKKSGNTK